MKPQPYTVPAWATGLKQPLSGRIPLGNLNTPLQEFDCPALSDILELTCFVKRDDATGFDVSGNKIRKLEFLLADAVAKGARRVVTIGGIQSNHCRATAVASRRCGLDPYLIQRHSDPTMDPGVEANLGLSRMVGAKLKFVTQENYEKAGSDALVEELCSKLDAEFGEKDSTYGIPVGGSNWLGTWGYLNFVEELRLQLKELDEHIDHIVVACGSGGTTAGIALGVQLAGLPSKVTAIGVSDNANYFENHIRKLAADLGVDISSMGPVSSWVQIVEGKGAGYAQSTEAELEFISQVSMKTGILFDPCYSGKALYAFSRFAKARPDTYKPGQKLLFVHTGGAITASTQYSVMLSNLPKKQIEPLNSSLF